MLLFFFSFFSVAPFAPLLKYTCYMCNRQGAHKSHRISSSLCSHDNALLYLYWYLHFMLIWPWCILSYVWWEAIKPFWILNLESKRGWGVIEWHQPRIIHRQVQTRILNSIMLSFILGKKCMFVIYQYIIIRIWCHQENWHLQTCAFQCVPYYVS